jgi:hypothetical protein
MTEKERFFKLFLRISGSVALLALVAVFMPYSWMNIIHQQLGLGELPNQPIVGYLARSTSAFYAFFGSLLWCLSFHLNRYRPVVHFLGAMVIVFGVIILIIDLREGLPLYWSLTEGPINIALGAIIFILSRRPNIYSFTSP